MTQPASILNGRVVRCAHCRTDDYGLPDYQLSEHHISVRFPNQRHLRGYVTVTLNGVDVTRDCYEALAGSEGFVALYVRDTFNKRILCANGYGHCIVEIHRGRVVVKRRQARNAPPHTGS